MLCIKAGGIKDEAPWGSWHVGETMKIPNSRVVTFQMDGHELSDVLDALWAYGVKIQRTDKRTPIL